MNSNTESDYISQDNPLYGKENDALQMPLEDVSDDYCAQPMETTHAKKATCCHAVEVASVALLLVAIAVLAIVAYCAFSRRREDFARWPAVEGMRREMLEMLDAVRGNVVFVEKDDAGNVKTSSVRDKYVVGFFYVNGRRENFSVFYNHSEVSYVNANYTLEDIGGVLYACSAERKNCSAVDVEEAYDKPVNVTREVVLVGDVRYARKEGARRLEEKVDAIEGRLAEDVDFEKFKEDPRGYVVEGCFVYNGKTYNVYKVYNDSDNSVDAGDAGEWELHIGKEGVEVCQRGKDVCKPLEDSSYKKVDGLRRGEVEDMLAELLDCLKSRVE